MKTDPGHCQESTLDLKAHKHGMNYESVYIWFRGNCALQPENTTVKEQVEQLFQSHENDNLFQRATLKFCLLIYS